MKQRQGGQLLLTMLYPVILVLLIISIIYAETMRYSYDDMDRLAQADYGMGQVVEYSYDPMGNRTTYKSRYTAIDIDGDGLYNYDEIYICGADPHRRDSDGDGLADGAELVYWGEKWKVDYDNDGSNNLIDRDADNDGYWDKVEIDEGYDPSNPNSKPPLPKPSATGRFNIAPILDLLLSD